MSDMWVTKAGSMSDTWVSKAGSMSDMWVTKAGSMSDMWVTKAGSMSDTWVSKQYFPLLAESCRGGIVNTVSDGRPFGFSASSRFAVQRLFNGIGVYFNERWGVIKKGHFNK